MAANASALTQGTTLLTDAVLGDLTRIHDAAQVAEKVKKRVMVCCVCGEGGKYRCPGCKRETCSVGCVKKHKETYECDGKRKPGLVGAGEYDENTMYEDYFYLEKFSGVVKGFRKALPNHQPFSLDTLPTPMHYLREAAKARGIHLTIQSKGLKRNVDNISRFISKTDTVLWRVDVTVVLPEGGEFVFSRLVNERHRVADVIENLKVLREKKLRKMQVWNKHWEVKKRKREYLITRDGATEEDLVGREQGAHSGTVTKWDEDRGFGFITYTDPETSTQTQLFAHRRALSIVGGGSLQRNASVFFDITTEPNPTDPDTTRSRAVNISGPGVVPLGSLTRTKSTAPPPPVPGPGGKRVCDFYWRSKHCKNGHRCQFLHVFHKDDGEEGGGGETGLQEVRNEEMTGSLREEEEEKGVETKEDFVDLCSALEGGREGDAATISTTTTKEHQDNEEEEDDEKAAEEKDFEDKRTMTKWAATVEELRLDSKKDEVREGLSAATGTLQGYRVLMQANRLGTEVAYHDLDPTQSFAENLKTVRYIVEYPSIVILPTEVFKGSEEYPLLTTGQIEQQRARWQIGEIEPRKEEKPATPEELRKMRKVPCKYFRQKGSCNSGDECRFMHTFEIPYCKTLQNLGMCPLKERCFFSHTRYDPHDPENKRKIPHDLRSHFQDNPRDRARDVRDVRAEVHARLNNLPMPTFDDGFPDRKRPRRNDNHPRPFKGSTNKGGKGYKGYGGGEGGRYSGGKNNDGGKRGRYNDDKGYGDSGRYNDDGGKGGSKGYGGDSGRYNDERSRGYGGEGGRFNDDGNKGYGGDSGRYSEEGSKGYGGEGGRYNDDGGKGGGKGYGGDSGRYNDEGRGGGKEYGGESGRYNDDGGKGGGKGYGGGYHNDGHSGGKGGGKGYGGSGGYGGPPPPSGPPPRQPQPRW